MSMYFVDYSIILPLIAVALTQLADIWTTLRFLKHGYTELNPFIGWAMKTLGTYGWILVKLLMIAAVSCAAYFYDQMVWLYLVSAVTGLVAVNNYRLVK